MHITTHRYPACVLSLIAGTTLLVACGRDDQRTPGQKVDAVIAQAERKTNQAAASARDMGRDAKEAFATGTDAIANKAKDVAISAEVKALFARDTKLSAIAIDVDSSAGHVVLRGTAPDAVSRTHAAELARGVNGVTSVTNELKVRGG